MPETLEMTLNSKPTTWLTLRQVASSGTITRTSYPVFSGTGADVNNPKSTDKADAGPLPKGTYYVVDRPTGGRLGGLRDWLGGKDIWFALYRKDAKVDDPVGVTENGVGDRHLHPPATGEETSGVEMGDVVGHRFHRDLEWHAGRQRVLEIKTATCRKL